MSASLARQRASIRKQAESALALPPAVSAEEPGFFSFPWPAADNGSGNPGAPKPAVAYLPPAYPAADLTSAGKDCDPLAEKELDTLVAGASKRHGVDAELLRQVARKESGWRPCAVSPKGALGLMQLMPATAAMLEVRNPFDARENIDAGARFLKSLLERYGGNLKLALSAYNAGPERVDAKGEVPQIAETQDYVGDILRSLRVE